MGFFREALQTSELMKTSFFIVFATSVVLLLGTNVRGEYLEDRQSDQTGQSEIVLSEQKRNGASKNEASKRLSSDYLYRFVKRSGRSGGDYLYRFARSPGSDYLYRFARGGNDDYLYRFVKRNGGGGGGRNARLDQDYYTRFGEDEPLE